MITSMEDGWRESNRNAESRITGGIVKRRASLPPFCLGLTHNPVPRRDGVPVKARPSTQLRGEARGVTDTGRHQRRDEGSHDAGAAFPVLLLRPNLTSEERALTLEAFRPMLEVSYETEPSL